MTSFAFYAIGTPAPKGSKRHVGHGVMVEQSKNLEPWVEAVKRAAPPISPPLDGPLAVRMVFTLPRPASARNADTAPYRGVDLDKLARGVGDAITQAGLWVDDSRISEYERLAKVWWGHDDEALPVPGVVVACRTLASWDELLGMTLASVNEATVRRRGVAS